MLVVKSTTTARFLLYPAVCVSFNIGLAALLCNVYFWNPGDGSRNWLAIGSSLSNLLANASIAIVTLTFSLTVLSIQIASQTYSPRLLDDFLQDPISQTAVSVNLGAYAYSFILQYWLFDEEEFTTTGVPILAIHFLSVHMVLVLLMFVTFIHYFINNFRLESILHRATEASWQAGQRLEALNKEGLRKNELPDVPPTAYKVLADHSGYLSEYKLDDVLDPATKLDICIYYHPNIGEFIAEGSLLAYVWDAKTTTEKQPSSFHQRVLEHSHSFGLSTRMRNSKKPSNPTTEQLQVEEKLGQIIESGLEITTARSGYLDVLLGVQQLTDVAVRALSAAVNDPMTAIQALDYLSTLFGRLARLRFPAGCVRDKEGQIRATTPRRSFAYLLSILDSIRFYGGEDLQVCYRLIRFYGDLGATLQQLQDENGRIPNVLAQIEQCMMVCRKKFGQDSLEMKSIREVYDYSMSLMVTSGKDRPVLQQDETIERDLTDLETTYAKPTSMFFKSLPENIKNAIQPLNELVEEEGGANGEGKPLPKEPTKYGSFGPSGMEVEEATEDKA